MTDKQIIIHGVDISKCEYHSKLLEGVCTFYGRCAKTYCPYKINWLKEQLQSKEQECEELTSKCSQLEEENKDYIKALEHLEIVIKDFSQEVVKLKQTLTEIKEIAKPYNDMSGNCVIVNFFKDMNVILQKINEVEDVPSEN